MLKIKKVSFKYASEPVLSDISFEVQPGEFVSIVGPNGSGKTTLLRLITGYLQPLSGSVLLNNKNVIDYRKKALAKKISVVSQFYLVNPHFTVEKLVQMGRNPYRSFFKHLTLQDKKMTTKILEKLQLTELQQRVLKTLSGGELQRAMIAKALVQDTPIILMDEPVNHLDIHHQIEVLNLLRAYQKAGKTIITVLHDLNFAARYSDKLVVLDNRLAAYGSPEQVLDAKILKDVFQTADYTVSRNLRVVLK